MIKSRLSNLVGKEAYIWTSGLVIYVTIEEIKVTYGKIRYLVSPVQGEGKSWVENVQLLGCKLNG